MNAWCMGLIQSLGRDRCKQFGGQYKTISSPKKRLMLARTQTFMVQFFPEKKKKNGVWGSKVILSMVYAFNQYNALLCCLLPFFCCCFFVCLFSFFLIKNIFVHQVFFVDYGNSEWTRESHVKRMLPHFLHLPFQALECFLGNVEPTYNHQKNGKKLDWSEDAM